MATMRVVQTLQKLNKGAYIYQEPKTQAGRHTIALSPVSCLELRAHREDQERGANSLGIDITDDTLIFSHPDNSTRLASTLTLAIRRLADRVALQGVRLHDLRHAMSSI